MTILTPFAYPLAAHRRRHGPSGYVNYQDYKPWLRDEFVFRCVYCLERETWYPDGAASFSVDHLVPQSQSEALRCDYSNLVYACTRCNSARQDTRTLDPTRNAFGKHLRVAEDGSVQGLTAEGKDLIDLLHLDTEPALRTRRHYLRILRLKATYPNDSEINQLYLEAFGYPRDLPDLASLKPPSGNSLEQNRDTCFYELRNQGRLGQVF